MVVAGILFNAENPDWKCIFEHNLNSQGDEGMKGGIMMRLGSKPRIGVFLVILVLLTSCSSRCWLRPDETDLRVGETVYRLETLEGDTVSYVALAYTGTSNSTLRDEEYHMPYGKGGEYDGAFVHGVLRDGTERYVSIEHISMIEVDRFNTAKTVLYIGGGLVFAFLVLLAAGDGWGYIGL